MTITVEDWTAAGHQESPEDGDAKPPTDLRLAGLAMATWLTALAGLYLGAWATLAVTAAAVIGILAVLGCRRTGRWPSAGRYGWLVIAVLLGVVCGGAATTARLAVRDAAPIVELTRNRVGVTASLVVRDDPRAVSGTVGRPQLYLIPAELSWLRASGQARITAPARILVLATHPAWRQLLPGQRLTATGRLAEPRGGDLTAAVLSTGTAPLLHGEPSWAQRAAGSLRAGLRRACAPLPDEPGGLLPGLVVGDTSRLEPAVEDDFRTTGMTHLNAVSGSNVAIVIGLVLLLTRWGRAGPWLAAGLCAIALVGFVILARPSPSVVRAAAMGAIGLIGLATGRPRAALPALGAAVTVLVIADPALAGDAGFALSVLATAGLLLIAPRWRDALRRRGVPAGLAEALAVPAAAQAACGPVVAGLSATVSLVAVPANLLAVPAIAPATVLGVITAVISPLWPAAAEFVAWLGSWPAWWLVLVARYGAQLPGGTLPWPGGVGGGLLLGALTLALLVAGRHRVVRRLVAALAAGLLVGALPVRMLATGWPPPGWLVVGCAVGQGDTVVLPVAPGQAVVIDAGPDPAAADRCLRRLGVRSVPLVVISHFHADHTAGLSGVLRGRRVGAVVTPQWREPVAGLDGVRRTSAARGVPVTAVGPGWSYAAGGLRLALLGPAYPLHGTRSDPNNNSLVLRAEVHGVRILLPGDAEVEEQRALREQLPADTIRAEILKVAHHGSAYQDPEFLKAVDPRVALVCVGTGNDYGHPDPDLIQELRRDGARVLRTDTQGDVAAVRRPDGELAVAVRGLVAGERRR